MRVEQFKKLDYYHIEIDSRCGFFDWASDKGQIAGMFETMEKMQSFWSVWDGNEVILIYGLIELWPGVADISLFYSVDFFKHYRFLCKHLKYVFSCTTTLYSRLQMYCLKDPRFLRFGQFFGFEVEGVLRKYGKNGEDYYILSWIKED